MGCFITCPAPAFAVRVGQKRGCRFRLWGTASNLSAGDQRGTLAVNRWKLTSESPQFAAHYSQRQPSPRTTVSNEGVTLLKLKKLQILGFKSFCDRTELKFHGEGIAAIIGPNGCGKSNIADAISWVLGEQSAKSLRGSRMEDVIFSGTRDRNPTGMAEVCLTLIDPEIYGGPDTNGPNEIEIQDELPSVGIDGDENWDEAEVRAHAAAETERAVKEAQPGKSEEIEGTASAEAPANDTAVAVHEPQLVLKIRRRKFNQQQSHAGEISVTRRLFRSGDSEYLLNGKLCRLRDIQELFMGTGLGPESYALIEQGRIGQILSSRPTDRRAIIEEAAGITKFKTKKRLAEARLEDAKVNLARINDIFDEVTRQMNSLKRQASKAERYAKLREEMRAKLRQVLASKAKELDLDAERLAGLLGEISQHESQQTQSVNQMETEQERLGTRTYELEGELRQHQNVLGQTALELDRSENRILFNRQRTEELKNRRQQLHLEIEQASAQAAQVESRAGEHGKAVSALQGDVA